MNGVTNSRGDTLKWEPLESFHATRKKLYQSPEKRTFVVTFCDLPSGSVVRKSLQTDQVSVAARYKQAGNCKS